MVEMVCLRRNKNSSGKIVSYLLVNAYNKKQIKEVETNKLKELIGSGQVVVKNLQMDKLGRLRSRKIM